jgi:hypothetical protein
MPSGKNWLSFLYVNIAFTLYIAGVFYYNQLAEVKSNWPMYRCNPMYMGFADNIEENFTYCVQNMQSGFMGHLLQPLTFITGSLSSMMGGFANDIQNIRAMFDKIRTFFSKIIQTIFGVFLNLIIEFQKIIIGIKDLMGKIIGIMVSFLYILDTSVKTMKSTWKGPPGQMVRSLGKCFHPDTQLKLKDGSIKCIKDVQIGDILEDGGFVETTMKIDNTKEKVSLFQLSECGVNGENIYVTGSHLVFDPSANTFVRVDDYSKSSLAKEIDTDWFVCLITSSHKIPIGDEIFWDWEDHFVKYPLGIININKLNHLSNN